MPRKLKPVTPQQALNNFKLLIELSDRNSYAAYRASVQEIARAVLARGIEGDDQNKNPTPSLN